MVGRFSDEEVEKAREKSKAFYSQGKHLTFPKVSSWTMAPVVDKLFYAQPSTEDLLTKGQPQKDFEPIDLNLNFAPLSEQFWKELPEKMKREALKAREIEEEGQGSPEDLQRRFEI